MLTLFEIVANMPLSSLKLNLHNLRSCLFKAKGTCEDYAQGGLGSSIGPFSSSPPPATLSPAARPATPMTEGKYL